MRSDVTRYTGRAIKLMKSAGVAVEIFRFVHFSRINSGRSEGFWLSTEVSDLSEAWELPTIGRITGELMDFWPDTHYEVRVPVVAQLQQAFMDNWLETRAELLHGHRYFPRQECAGEQICQIFKSSAGEGSDSGRLMLLVSIAAARHHIRTANAYFIPDNLTMLTLLEALRRGVKIEIITPGADIDGRTVRAAGKARWKPLLNAGACF